MRRENLPEDGGPFETDVADVESIQDPRPLSIAETQVFLRPSSFGVADVSSVEVG